MVQAGRTVSDKLVFLLVVLWVTAAVLVTLRVHECPPQVIEVTEITVTHPSQVTLIVVPERETGNQHRRGNA